MTRPQLPPVSGTKEQLKIQIDPGIHQKLRALCDLHRRTPAGQIEHMALFFFQRDLEGEGPGLRPGKKTGAKG